MKIIQIIGLFSFLYFAILYNSYRCYIIFINGILCHYNPTNKFFLYNDIIINAILIIYTIYYYPKTLPFAIIGSICWCVNSYFNKHLYSNSIIHVLFTQFIFCYALVKYSID